MVPRANCGCHRWSLSRGTNDGRIGPVVATRNGPGAIDGNRNNYYYTARALTIALAKAVECIACRVASEIQYQAQNSCGQKPQKPPPGYATA